MIAQHPHLAGTRSGRGDAVAPRPPRGALACRRSRAVRSHARKSCVLVHSRFTLCPSPSPPSPDPGPVTPPPRFRSCTSCEISALPSAGRAAVAAVRTCVDEGSLLEDERGGRREKLAVLEIVWVRWWWRSRLAGEFNNGRSLLVGRCAPLCCTATTTQTRRCRYRHHHSVWPTRALGILYKLPNLLRELYAK